LIDAISSAHQLFSANVLLNTVGPAGWRVEVWILGADGVTFVDWGFQFVAAQVS
jgi:hypothetical protein